MRRFTYLIYGVVSYAIFFATDLYAVGFIGGFGAPTTLDGEPTAPLVTALLVNLGLLGLFAVQHSVMARPTFKRWWTRLVRHPMCRGWFLAFWATPTMTMAHLLFAGVTTAYILVANQLEERNLVDEFGEAYREYRRREPRVAGEAAKVA